MKILIVDDHHLFLDGLKNLLTIRGIEVVGTATDGLEALEKARALKPEVILMDIQMPQLNGLAATRLIKAEQPKVKIVMLTYSENDEDLFKAIKSGAADTMIRVHAGVLRHCRTSVCTVRPIPSNAAVAGRRYIHIGSRIAMMPNSP